jgi:hypothetical protein
VQTTLWTTTSSSTHLQRPPQPIAQQHMPPEQQQPLVAYVRQQRGVCWPMAGGLCQLPCCSHTRAQQPCSRPHQVQPAPVALPHRQQGKPQGDGGSRAGACRTKRHEGREAAQHPA